MTDVIDLSQAPEGAFFTRGGWTFQGAKGGGGGGLPFDWPNTLKSVSLARVLDVVSEGEIQGLVNGLQSVYLNETPLQNADGTYNFSRVKVDFRNGTQHQAYISGFPAYEETESIGVEIKEKEPWTKALTDLEASAVRVTISVQGLQISNIMNGDVLPYVVRFAVDISTDGGPFVEILPVEIMGKTSSTYQRTVRVDLPKAKEGWNIRVRRTVPDSQFNTILDKTYVSDFTKVIDGKLRHPNSALFGVSVDAEQFSNVPTRGYELDGMIIAVPDNYDPETREYRGTWEGGMKRAYSNNPAWVLYDMLTNGRYGLGIHPDSVDRFALYKIGQYCDQMVDDGEGGKEPRFTCNAYLQSAADAYKIVQDIASIFRGLVYWGGRGSAASVMVVADMPKQADYVYTNAKVVDSFFQYASSPRKRRCTVAIVSWNDPQDFYRQKVEVYEERDYFDRYGINKIEVTALGCTSKGQALRMAKWLVLTSCLETETISFSVGLEGAIAAPGMVIKVADQFRAGRRIGGLVRQATNSKIEIDSDLVVKAGDKITVVLPDGTAETRTVSETHYHYLTVDTDQITADSIEITADMIGLPQTVTEVEVYPAFSQAPVSEAQWSLESEDLSTQLFRVISVTNNGDNTFSISGIQYVPEKFDMVEHGIHFDPPPISVVPPKVQAAPENVRISNYSTVEQGLEVINARIEWDQTDDAVEYEVQWRRDGSDWVAMPRTATLGAEIQNAYKGTYEARVRAYNALKVYSLWAKAKPTELEGTLPEPPIVSFLKTHTIVFGVELSWAFPEGRHIINSTEIWYSTTPNFEQAQRFSEFAYPQTTFTLTGQRAGQKHYFWARVKDKNGTLGAFYPDGAGIEGKASDDASDILDQLGGEIKESHLGQELAKKINDSKEAATQIQELVDSTSAMITAKAEMTKDGQYALAGIGIGVEQTPEGTLQSQVIVTADRFAVLHDLEGGEPITPFVIENGQVFMNEAMIKQLTSEQINVGQLSELTQDAGILVAGKLQGTHTNSFIDLNAQGEEQVINFGNGAMTVTADGEMKINKANVIDTLQLAGNAVSVMEVFEGRDIWNVNGGSVKLQTQAGANVIVFVNVSAFLQHYNQSAIQQARVELLRNGTVIKQMELNLVVDDPGTIEPRYKYTLSNALMIKKDTPPMGEMTYSVRMAYYSPFNPIARFDDLTIMALMMKR